jgi:uncharacterized protein involved in outer membrane biogenesis
MAGAFPVNANHASFLQNMKWLTRGVLVLLVLAGVVALVPFFVTLNDYVPQVESELSARLKTPVSIDTLHASLVPIPHVRVEGIAIGKAEEIKVAKVTLNPDLWSLFRSNKVIRSVEFEDVVLSQSAFGPLLELAQGDSGPGTVTIEKIQLKTAVIKLEQGSFGPFDAEVRVGSGDQQGGVTLKTQDGALQARVVPAGKQYTFEVSAKSWTPPLGPKIRFDSLQVKGIATGDQSELNEINAKLYGGTISGKSSIDWAKGVKISGQFDVKQVELKDAAALVSPKTRVSGRLDAMPKFSAHAATAAQLDEALRLETPFTVRHGVLYGLDLPGAVAALTKHGQSGGQTQFEELEGRLLVERGAYRFTQLRIASGALAARGNVTIGANKSLSGQFNATVKAAGAATNVPLVVAGTLESPMVYPNTTAVVGAAAGAIGGTLVAPGVGTAAGAKIGEFAQELLGNKSRKP